VGIMDTVLQLEGAWRIRHIWMRYTSSCILPCLVL
jgi:hypothetical protein